MNFETKTISQCEFKSYLQPRHLIYKSYNQGNNHLKYIKCVSDVAKLHVSKVQDQVKYTDGVMCSWRCKNDQILKPKL